jgi:hypothetical protein
VLGCQRRRRRLFHGVRRLESVIVHVDPSGMPGDGDLTHHHDQPSRHAAVTTTSG